MTSAAAAAMFHPRSPAMLVGVAVPASTAIGQQLPQRTEQLPRRVRRLVAIALLDRVAHQLPQVLPVGIGMLDQQVGERDVAVGQPSLLIDQLTVGGTQA